MAAAAWRPEPDAAGLQHALAIDGFDVVAQREEKTTRPRRAQAIDLVGLIESNDIGDDRPTARWRLRARGRRQARRRQPNKRKRDNDAAEPLQDDTS